MYRKFEKDIKQSSNDDDELFETYAKYIEWIQQNYPRGGKEIKFSEILEKCIKTFFNKKQYQNNERMLSIFLCYTNIVANPQDVFKVFYKQNFAKKLSTFYIEWAYLFEMQNKYKQAIQVIKLGIENEAEPLSRLKQILNDLEVRTMRFVISNPEEPVSERKALNKLKTIKDSEGKSSAPVKRTLIEDNNGIDKIFSDNIPKNDNVPVKIYTENETASHPPVDNDNEEINKFYFNQKLKENEMKTHQWKGNKLDIKKAQTKNIEKFEIFCDSNNDIAKNTHSDEPKYPVVIFGDKEKLKGWILYDRIDEIYRNGTEYSLEEIKYQKWVEDQELKKQKPNAPVVDLKNSEPETAKLLFSDTKNLSQMISSLFNGTLCKTMNQTHLERSPTTQEKFEIFQDDQKKLGSTFNENNELKSCSSSTPFQNKTLKLQQNLAMLPLNNKLNYVDGITVKLSPIVELSREEYSKSSSSSSSSSSSGTIMSSLTTKKVLLYDNIDPFDSYNRKKILSAISDPVEFRMGYYKKNQILPAFNLYQFFEFFGQNYIIDNGCKSNTNEFYVFERLSNDLDMITSNSKRFIKLSRCLDYWEFYIYDELKRRLFQNNCGTDIVRFLKYNFKFKKKKFHIYSFFRL